MWFKVDDSLPTHHRVIAAGNAAMGLWVRCGAWSMGQLTDGFIPTEVALMFGTQEQVDALLRTGLWNGTEGGYQFFRWAEDGSGAQRQPTRAEVEEKRKTDRERKATAMSAARSRRTPRGVATDSARNPDGSHTEGQRDSTAPSGRSHAYPDPTRPDPTSVLSPTSKEQTGGASAHPLLDLSEPLTRCPEHLATAVPPKCGRCKDARLAHEQWALVQAARQAPARAVKHIPGLCDDHRQKEGECEMCARENAHAAEIIHGVFGGAA